MKKIVLLILICSGQPVMAQDHPTSSAPETDRSTSSGKKVNKESEPLPVVWPKPFTPSEEIGADSQISFPTDI